MVFLFVAFFGSIFHYLVFFYLFDPFIDSGHFPNKVLLFLGYLVNKQLRFMLFSRNYYFAIPSSLYVQGSNNGDLLDLAAECADKGAQSLEAARLVSCLSVLVFFPIPFFHSKFLGFFLHLHCSIYSKILVFRSKAKKTCYGFNLGTPL